MTIEDRIRSDIEGRIRSGEWRPGQRIPFEHELVESYKCSRATVSKAMAALVRSGLIQRRRKAGTFVAQPQIHSAVMAIPDLAQLLEARGETHRWTLLSESRRRQGWVPGELQSSGTLLALDGIHHASERPFAFEERLIDLGTVADAATTNFRTLAPGSWLLDHVAWSDARHRISAVAAGAAQAGALKLPSGTACLQVERWTWRAGRFVTYARQLFPGERFDLIAEFKAQG
jgi:GntR family transcriptional regulator, histidine utilization repressor